ncbi:MAG TPA: hypothetical protein VN625_06555, partial [Desulfuromonadaceae bacterium]|nr:hypothetical protein [Desulfuromonadaceae bacterium]
MSHKNRLETDGKTNNRWDSGQTANQAAFVIARLARRSSAFIHPMPKRVCQHCGFSFEITDSQIGED